jgi:hypothetical protein
LNVYSEIFFLLMFAAMLHSLAVYAVASPRASRSSLAAVVRQQPLTCAVTLQAALRCAALKIAAPAEDVLSADVVADADADAVQMLMLCARTVLCGGLFSSAFTGPGVVTAAPGESASMFTTQLAGLCATSIKAASVSAATIWPADGASAVGIDSQQVEGDASGAAEAALAAARLACDAARNAAAVAAQQGEPVAAVWITLVARAGAHVGGSHTLAL